MPGLSEDRKPKLHGSSVLREKQRKNVWNFSSDFMMICSRQATRGTHGEWCVSKSLEKLTHVDIRNSVMAAKNSRPRCVWLKRSSVGPGANHGESTSKLGGQNEFYFIHKTRALLSVPFPLSLSHCRLWIWTGSPQNQVSSGTRGEFHFYLTMPTPIFNFQHVALKVFGNDVGWGRLALYFG